MWRNGREFIKNLFKRRPKRTVLYSKLEPRSAADSDRSDIRVLEDGPSVKRHGDYEHGSSNIARQAEGERLISLAKENRLYIEKERWRSFGDQKRLPSGESIVFLNEQGTRVIKVRDPFAKAAIKHLHAQDVIYEHLIHNILFPSTKYKFEGISEDIDGVRVVLSQDYISKSFIIPTQYQIDNYLSCVLGLQQENKYFWGNEYVSITDVSANSDNVLMIDQELFFIDPIIVMKRPAIEVLEYYYQLLQ
ncbi:MAG: hypothetical protein J5629_06640 [Muribaculaceae bacterium]|nr:hypothetical protein [Muribaculaceae bacterium]